MTIAMTSAESAWRNPSRPPEMCVSESPDEPCVPDLEEIPQQYEQRDYWLEFQRTWFEDGLEQIAEVRAKDGVNEACAFAHLSAIQSCFTISQEHKEKAVAWLASLWLSGWSRSGE